MKITDVTTLTFGHAAFVQVHTDEGITGLGEITLDGRELTAVRAIEHFRAQLVDRDPFDIERIWQTLYRGTFWRGGPALLTALSGLDIALWDLKGKALHTPVFNLLGGRARDRILVYCHIGGQDEDELCRHGLQKVEAGYRVLRIAPDPRGGWDAPFEPGPAIRRHVKMFRALRAAVGDEIEICTDVHTRLSPARAIEYCNALAEYRPYFVEDPIRSESPEAFALLRAHTSVPLATGEQLGAKWDFRNLIENDWIDYVRADLIHCGGLTEGRKIAAMAETHYQEMTLHNAASPVCGMASLHLDHALPNFLVQEFGLDRNNRQRWDQILDFDFEFKDGYVTIPPRPGLGIELRQPLRPDEFRMWELPHLHREDGSFQDW